MKFFSYFASGFFFHQKDISDSGFSQHTNTAGRFSPAYSSFTLSLAFTAQMVYALLLRAGGNHA